ncbi:bifunctional 4-hydroxy-2-oxoglutarate aldolase/2-dehydro-3-deoxy-phosphogluconate aldolase [Arhodomonas sp. AD133]|uniref:bifunctional 4-hydroxy-2-oxoglutarate aldolase/2-dehydro-3-deoxy-phosphogluconate aldolase n=1 Tax=Arhodomonas sp. AD133 TaxID=3415009 RepID=UPI003EB6AB98
MVENNRHAEALFRLIDGVPVIPVLQVERVDDAVPLAQALVAGGLPVLEVTLRSDSALAVIERMARDVPNAVVGAGTVNDPSDYAAARDAGAQFAVSPGATDALIDVASAEALPWLPGAATASEVMRLRGAGYRFLKFFPAVAAGGRPALKALGGPFADVRFCPTGGVKANDFHAWLALGNVVCVGGSWLAPPSLVDAGDWEAIRAIARQAVDENGSEVGEEDPGAALEDLR